MTRIQVNPMHTSYGAFGHRAGRMSNAATAFAGEVMERGGLCYLLGDRLYSPALRRFLGPDSLSPFDRGGVNRYAYCSGDPINRVDPGGHAWWEWVATGLGLVAAVAGTVATAGALAGVIGAAAAGSLTAAIATPSMASLVTATLLDVVAVTAEIGSIASEIAGDESAMGIFGWVAVGAGAASTAAAVTPRLAKLRHVGRARAPHGDRSPLITGEHMAGTRGSIASNDGLTTRRILISESGEPYIEPRWHRHALTHRNGAISAHWLADSEATSSDLKAAFEQMKRWPADTGNPNVYVYHGVHGAEDGFNWLLGKRARPMPWNDVERSDIADVRLLFPHLVVQAEDIYGLTEGEFVKRMWRTGTHVHQYCYSAMDPVVRRRLHLGTPPT